MLFRGGCLEIHPYASGCITQHQGGECSVRQFREEQEGRVDKRFIKYLPSILQSGEDYMVNKMYLAGREMFNEDRKIEMGAL